MYIYDLFDFVSFALLLLHSPTQLCSAQLFGEYTSPFYFGADNKKKEIQPAFSPLSNHVSDRRISSVSACKPDKSSWTLNAVFKNQRIWESEQSQ